MRLLVIGLVVVVLVAGQDTDRCPDTHLCNKDYCNNCYFGCNPSTLPPEVVNGSWVKMYENLDDYCDCCREVFVPDIAEGERCFTSISGFNLQSKGVCGKGLSCQNNPDSSGYSCQRIVSPCHAEQDRYDKKLEEGVLGMDESRPTCDDDGFYTPLQCYFSGVCRCVDKNTGEPTFGFVVNPETANSEGVDCACAREVEELREMSCSMQVDYDGPTGPALEKFVKEYSSCTSSRDYYFKDALRCLPNGNFDKAQCIPQVVESEDDGTYEEICLCIDDDLNLNSSVATIGTASVTLECHFLDDLHFDGYYRPCEKEQRERNKMMRRVEDEGSIYLSTEWVGECGADGFYSLVQREPGDSTRGYCADRNNKRLEDFSGVFEQMNCLCAQVRAALLPTDDRPSCEPDGSFKLFQCRAEKCYCVNRFGKQVSMEEDFINFDPSTCTNLQ